MYTVLADYLKTEYASGELKWLIDLKKERVLPTIFNNQLNVFQAKMLNDCLFQLLRYMD